jgi:hypothetical protein
MGYAHEMKKKTPGIAMEALGDYGSLPLFIVTPKVLKKYPSPHYGI